MIIEICMGKFDIDGNIQYENIDVINGNIQEIMSMCYIPRGMDDL
jgi:hypothetical protein